MGGKKSKLKQRKNKGKRKGLIENKNAKIFLL